MSLDAQQTSWIIYHVIIFIIFWRTFRNIVVININKLTYEKEAKHQKNKKNNNQKWEKCESTACIVRNSEKQKSWENYLKLKHDKK